MIKMLSRYIDNVESLRMLNECKDWIARKHQSS